MQPVVETGASNFAPVAAAAGAADYLATVASSSAAFVETVVSMWAVSGATRCSASSSQLAETLAKTRFAIPATVADKATVSAAAMFSCTSSIVEKAVKNFAAVVEMLVGKMLVFSVIPKTKIYN